MQITVKLKSVFGIERIYPVCDKAKLFTRISGSATLMPHTIECIKELGYKIMIETRQGEL